MARSPLPFSQFVLPSGTPVSLGYVIVHLNKDCQIPQGLAGQVGAKIKSRLQLDSNGAVEGSPLFWPNSELAPTDSVYILWVYTEIGQLVLGPIEVTVGPSSRSLGFGQAFGSSFGS